MSKDRTFAAGKGSLRLAVFAALFLMVPAVATLSPENALAVQDGEEDQTFSSRVGQRVLDIIELEGEERWDEVVSAYTQLLDGGRLSEFEHASILKLRGRARYETDRAELAIADWLAAIDSEALPVDDINTLRINAGQLMMGEGRLNEAIELIETALHDGVVLNADLAMRLAQAYGQLEAYDDGLHYARFAFDAVEERQERHYSLLLFFHQSLDQVPEQLSLMGEMVDRWPSRKSYWSSYAVLLARSDREREAFEVNRVMYLNGMLTESAEVVRLAQYYSFFGYPYRGASILERELNSGQVDPTPENFDLLSNTWRQAREWERALPVLRRVATMTGAGPDYVKLGEALYQSGDFSEAEAVFTQALSRSDLNRTGDVWNLLGMVRYETRQWEAAIAAYEEGLRWEYSRATAQGWIDFIERRIALDMENIRIAERVRFEECQIHVEEVRRGETFNSSPSYDAEGRLILPIREDCRDIFDPYGDTLPDYERA